MGKMTPRERAAIIKRVKELNARIQDPRLSIERVDELHTERALLHAQLLEDRTSSGDGGDRARQPPCTTSPLRDSPIRP